MINRKKSYLGTSKNFKKNSMAFWSDLSLVKFNTELQPLPKTLN